MSLIEVRAPGLLTTVQDLGREGFGPMGVSPSGAADAVALRIGNRLLGNAEGAAALELTLLGGTFFFREAAVVALTGSNFAPTLDDQRVETWSSVEIRAGQTLQMGPTQAGARSYLCVRGGIDVKLFLGSASTHLLSGLGGFEGRALRKGDVLKVGRALEGFRTFRKRNLARRALEKLAPRKVLRVTAGPQSDWFSKEAQKLFYARTYRVTEETNRMGLRLEGAAIASAAGGEPGGGDAASGPFHAPLAPAAVNKTRAAAFAAMKPYIALYMGGMGAEDTNFHADVYRRMGYGEVVDRRMEANAVNPEHAHEFDARLLALALGLPQLAHPCAPIPDRHVK